MLEQLKKQSMKDVMIRLVICAIIILILLGVTRSSLLKLIKGPQDFSSLSLEELPDAYVNGDINVIIDVFAEYYEENDDGTEEITKNYYVIPFGEDKYIGLNVSKGDFPLANLICDETYEYLMGTRDDLTSKIQVTGTVNKMNEETYGYYLDWFEKSQFLENSTTEAIEAAALPYMLQVDYIGTLDSALIYTLLVCICLVLLYAIIILIKGVTGAYLSRVKKYIKHNDSNFSLERMEVDYLSSVPIESVRVGKT